MILVDSDVLISHLRGVGAARDWLLNARRDRGRLAASVVSVVEVGGGMHSGERAEVTRLLASLQIWPVDERVAWSAAELMRAHRAAHSGIGLGDYLVAATALVGGMELATLNVRHFPMFQGLRPPF
ncbi:MAG: type II toxin-antitoxin system VapC family toxin [Candidatus Dormiibacterota bacterium]